MFEYSSSTTHGYLAPNGKKVKTTNVNVSNGKGVVKLTIEDDDGIHSHIRRLKSDEIKNIESHRFMKGFFDTLHTNVRKKKTKTRRSNKKGTYKNKK
jgi:hypothetical protein